MIKVYVKTNENNEIIQIASSIFLENTEGWIEIDEGQGDFYAHCQSQYLEKGLMDNQGRYNYKLIDGEVIEIPEGEKPTVESTPQITTEERLNALEAAMLEMVLGGTEYWLNF